MRHNYKKQNHKKHNEMESEYVLFTRHFDTPDELSTKSLSDYTVSSTVTYGPNAALLKSVLDSLNEACRENQPGIVASLSKTILENGLTEFMEISKMEIILAHTRAVTLMHPELSVESYYEFMIHKFYQVHTASN